MSCAQESGPYIKGEGHGQRSLNLITSIVSQLYLLYPLCDFSLTSWKDEMVGERGFRAQESGPYLKVKVGVSGH